MADTEKELRTAIKAVLADRSPGPHPSPDDLAAYCAGRLSKEAEEQLQAHLGLCGDCARAALDMATFPEVEDRAGFSRTPQQEAEDRRIMEARLREETAGRGWVSRILSVRETVVLRALAACLLLTALGLSGWIVLLRQQLQEGGFSRPVPNVLYQELYSLEDSRTRDFSAGHTTKVPIDTDRVLWVLVLTDFPDFPGFEAEILDSQGTLIWRDAVDPMPGDIFSIEVHRGFLRAGTYLIRLYGLKDGQRTRTATFRTELTYEAP